MYRPTIGYFQHFGTSITNAYSTHFVKSSGLNAKAKFHYRSLSYAWYCCRLSFTLLRLFPNKGGCATTPTTDLPSATSAFWHFYNQCVLDSFRQVIWLECESKVSWDEAHNWEALREQRRLFLCCCLQLTANSFTVYRCISSPSCCVLRCWVFSL